LSTSLQTIDPNMTGSLLKVDRSKASGAATGVLFFDLAGQSETLAVWLGIIPEEEAVAVQVCLPRVK
jgi:hypothetical protein